MFEHRHKKGKVKPTILFAFVLLLCGCQNGCDFNRDTVLDTQTDRRTIDGIPVKITLDKIKETHYNIKWRFFKGESPKLSNQGHTHWLSVQLVVADRPTLDEAHFTPCNADQDLKPAMQAFEVHFSPQKQHFYTTYRQQYLKTYHLLSEGAPFCSPWSYRSSTAPAWKNLPEPDQIVRYLIENEDTLKKYPDCQAQLSNTLKQHKNLTPYDMLLTDRFPASDFASEVLTEERVTKVCLKSGEWKSKMIKRCLNDVEKKNYLSRSCYMLLYIADPAALAQTDAALFPIWASNSEANTYIKERLSTHKTPLPDAKLVKKLNEAANKELLTPKSDAQYVSDKAYDILFLLNDHSQFKAAIDKQLSPKFYTANQTHVDVTLHFCYDKFTTAEQQQIINGYKALLPKVENSFQRQFVFSFLSQHLPCNEAKKLRDQYPDLKEQVLNC